MMELDEFEDEQFAVCYADPPWRFQRYSMKDDARSPENHYVTQDLEWIKSLPVKRIMKPNSVLLMWTTDPFLEKSFEVMRAWGFEYKTMGFVWAKRTRTNKTWHMGLGYWTRANPEYCILGVRGKPKRTGKGVRKLIIDPVREHSRKPDSVYGSIEQLTDGPYLEMFGRTKRPGWSTWGNETEKF